MQSCAVLGFLHLLPHATFAGSDAQLDAAIKYLQEEIQKDPRPVPPPPPYPNKSFKYDK
jgi:tricorn protease